MLKFIQYAIKHYPTKLLCNSHELHGTNPVEQVLLAEVHRLRPSVVVLVEVGTDTSELKQLVLLQLLGQGDCIKVIKSVDGFS